MQHTMNVTDLDHSRPCFYASLLVLTLATGPTKPSMRALHHPAWRQWREAWWALWTCLHCEEPPRTLRCQPARACW